MKGKVAVVTGSTAGIGRSIALYFASAGAHVAVTDQSRVCAVRCL
ncbi:MAG: SDR family NAD(P)-dependent oxidoreductase [Desulfobacterales bacterium]|nr:SDR family NAD(P)-dependent oxidoreductase [Desulfobacterales bacterium]